MRTRFLRTIWLWVLLGGMGLLACDASTLVGMAGSKPSVTIQSPANGSVFREGDDVAVQATAKDDTGVVRVELSVDGAVSQTDTPPGGQAQTSFTLVQRWKAVAGAHTLGVRAYNSAGKPSDPSLVSVSVAPSGSASPTVLAAGAATATAMSTLTATSTPTGGVATVTLTPAITPTVGPTATRPPTLRPPAATATATVKAPPGIYALSIRVNPPTPLRGSPPTFYVTFLNSTGKPAGFRWFIKVFEPDKTNSKGETSKKDDTIPPGTHELAANADWKIAGPGPCEQFIARAFWMNVETKQTFEFSKPGASVGPTLGFQVCP